MTTQKKYNLPMGQFASNVSAEAILNKDSLLYHEDEGYSSGLIGYLKPFSQAVYGNYRLVEMLAQKNGSPLDIRYEVVWSWDASQLAAYCRVVLITMKSYLECNCWNEHSYALNRALTEIKNSCIDVYKLKDIQSNYYSSDIFTKLNTAVHFVRDAINLLGKQKDLPLVTWRIRKNRWDENLYDHIARVMFEIIFSAASVSEPADKCWDIHHNAVWAEFFAPYDEGNAWTIIRFKLRRLLYNEILRLDEFPNYKSSRVLGFCLNVMGLKIGNRKEYGTNYYALRKAVLTWTKNNYMRLRTIHPDVAKSCLMGSITFDEGSRLVKTYIKGLELEPPKEYLELAAARPSVP
jgi:hypothetical protein